MSAPVIRILVVGSHPPAIGAITARLGLLGWGFHAVDTLREARTALDMLAFDVVLSAEHLPARAHVVCLHRTIRKFPVASCA
jgi:CheY-like chemotaxis protein